MGYTGEFAWDMPTADATPIGGYSRGGIPGFMHIGNTPMVNSYAPWYMGGHLFKPASALDPGTSHARVAS